MPTMRGIFSLCNQDRQETELLEALITGFTTLGRYGLNRDGAEVTLLHYDWYSDQVCCVCMCLRVT